MQPISHLLHLVSPFAAAAAGSLVASVWQGILLAVAVWLSLRLLPGLSAAARSAVWTAVLLLILLLPALSTGLSSPGGTHTPVTFNHPQVLHLGEGWSLVLTALWAGLSAFRLLQLLLSAIRLRTLARNAIPIQPRETVQALLDHTSRQAELCTSPDVDRPSVAGFFRPRILLPEDLAHKLSERELEQVVLHELEHLRRCDDWTNLLQKLGLALLPLHPVLFWLDRRLCSERELACDDSVLRATRARKAYAACLAGLAEHSAVRRGVLLALGIFGRQRSELARRVYRILGAPEAVMGRTQMRVATGLVLAGVLAGGLTLATSPRLVSFGSGEAVSVPSMEAAKVFGPPAASAMTGAAHLNLAKATVLRVSAPHGLRGRVVLASAPSHVRKPQVVNTMQRQTLAARAAAHLVQTRYQANTSATPEFAAPRLVLAVDQDSQIRYAAVAVQGGWLIVQL